MQFISILAVLLLWAGSSFCQVNLAGTIVPKEKFRVFIFLGHSNMDGRGETLDTVTNPRLWMWDITRADPDPDYPSNGLAGSPRDASWRLSRDVAVGNSQGRAATPFLKKMLVVYPDYYFGAIQLSEWESIIPQAYLPGLCWYVRIVHYVNQILPKVTLQAIVTMLGWDDGCTANNAGSFDVNFTAMARQLRTDLSLPKLPVLVSQQETGHGCDNNIQPTLIAKTENIPALLAFSAVVRSSGPYIDDHHYNSAGLNKWADSAVALIKRKEWGPPPLNEGVGPSMPAQRKLGNSVARLVVHGSNGDIHGIAMAKTSERRAGYIYSLKGELLEGRSDWADLPYGCFCRSVQIGK